MSMSPSQPSFEQDIKPLFRESDRQAMDFLLDLWDYQDVRDNAQAILEQLSSGRMPCDSPWPDELVALFRRWTETGMLQSPSPSEESRPAKHETGSPGTPTTGPSQVVIVGAGAAGDAAAFALRKNGFDGDIALIGADPHRPYERPLLSKRYLRNEIQTERVFLRPPEEYERQRIELLLGRRVIEVSRREKAVVLDNGRRIHFDTLVLAPGGKPRWPSELPHLANAFTLRTLDDSIAVKQALAESRRMLLLGAGFIGAEVAASARMKGKEVLLVARGSVPLGRAVGQEVGQIYARIHRSHGVDLRTNTSVTRWLTAKDRVVGVELSDGSREEVDAVLVAVGIDADTGLARDLELELSLGGVTVDDALRAAPDIFCAGDIAAHLHPVFGRHLRVEHWQVAQRQGAACGAAIAGQPKPYDELPWFWSDQYNLNLQYVGNAPDFDQVVWRGDPESERFSVFYLKERVIEAVLSINDGRTGRQSRELIRRRLQIIPQVLSDPTTDLSTLAKAPL